MLPRRWPLGYRCECRAKVKVCSPSPVVVRLHMSEKIIQWNEQLQANEQTNLSMLSSKEDDF